MFKKFGILEALSEVLKPPSFRKNWRLKNSEQWECTGISITLDGQLSLPHPEEKRRVQKLKCWNIKLMRGKNPHPLKSGPAENAKKKSLFIPLSFLWKS